MVLPCTCGSLCGFGLGFFFLDGVFVFFNKAMEYLLLSVFVKGNNQNAENKACCTRLAPLKEKKMMGSNGEQRLSK